jgi:hypothetical protein
MSNTQDEVTKSLTEPHAPSPPNQCVSYMAVGLLIAITCCSIIGVTELGVLVSQSNDGNISPVAINIGGGVSTPEYTPDDGSNVPDELSPSAIRGENTCAGSKLNFPDIQCIVNGMTQVGPQAGANVTAGYQGTMEVDVKPITTPYYQKGMCPVNVHWHLGAEHLSVGEYDETGMGPVTEDVDGGINQGHQCTAYNVTDPKFTRPYQWKYCKDMEVGQTYEVHWPHSAAGACGTPNQYQTPFYDGVFCNLDLETFQTLAPQDISNAVGVQAQVFVVVNDESYFWPDMMRGMIVDGDFGSDVAKYTGSTTGDGRNNEICSQYTPITWQVDRKCHMISASSFDKLCYDMLQQRDNMSEDVHPHGARDTVKDELAPNNFQNRFLRTKKL